MSNSTRRDFLTASAGLLAAAQGAAQSGKKDRMIGLQIGAVSFVDEGVEPVLDILQSKGSVNTLFIAAFTFGRGIAGRQVPGQPRCPPSLTGLLSRDVPGVPARPVLADAGGGDPVRVYADESGTQVLAGDTGPHRPKVRPPR